MSAWLVLDSGVGPPAWNMALDEALMEHAKLAGVPTLRFYGWSEPAATFGYFQKYSEVEQMTPLRPLLRRPTGGGLVPHDHDWTYSVIIPPGDPWYELSAVQSYERVHRWIALSLARFNLQTSLSVKSWKDAPGQCFAGAERFDLLKGGRKIAGAAQRRSKQGLLIQGSLQPVPPEIGRRQWQDSMLLTSPCDGVKWTPMELPELTRVRAEAIKVGKYSQSDYNRKR